MQVAFYLSGEITQVKESIPWVRCASGNVFTFSHFECERGYTTFDPPKKSQELYSGTLLTLLIRQCQQAGISSILCIIYVIIQQFNVVFDELPISSWLIKYQISNIKYLIMVDQIYLSTTTTQVFQVTFGG